VPEVSVRSFYSILLTIFRFLWVNLQLTNICRQRSDQDIETELYNIPGGLDRTYARILQRIQQHPTALRELARRCLMWVFYAARPLHIKELLEAVQIEESARKRENFPRYDEEALIEACANLIEVNYGFVRPIHLSVKEYFISLESTAKPELAIQESPREFFVKATMAHTLLSHSCLSYLLQGFLDAGPCKDNYTFYHRLLTYRLASYSSYFFDNHLCQLSEVPKELGKLLKQFLSSRGTAFAAMMQLRALCGRGNDPLTAISLFTEMSQEVDAPTVIHSTSLADHPGLYDDIKSLLLASTPKYITHQTASGGLLAYTTRLIHEGYQVDERDPQNRTPLYHASRNGRREICYLLLKHGANVGATDDNGETALHGAAFGGHEAVVRLLVEDYKAEVEAKGDDGTTVLHLAAISGKEAAVRQLLEDYRANAEAKTDDGTTVLHTAAYGGNEAVVRLLVEDYKADVEAKTDGGLTVLHAAAMNGSEAVVRLLVEDYKADVEAKDSDGWTVLHAVAPAGNEAVVRLLVEDYKANVEAKDNYSWTVLHGAVSGGNEAVVRLLVEDYKADVEAKDSNGWTVLHAAAKSGNEVVVRLLVEDYKADVEAKDNNGWTVLHAAAKSGNEAIVRLLVEEYKADVEAKGKDDWTVLHAAAQSGNEAVVRLLVEDYKADVEAKTNRGKTALHLAKDEGNEAAMRVLESAEHARQGSQPPHPQP
jgi:ankyrin repeat protein